MRHKGNRERLSPLDRNVVGILSLYLMLLVKLRIYLCSYFRKSATASSSVRTVSFKNIRLPYSHKKEYFLVGPFSTNGTEIPKVKDLLGVRFFGYCE